MPNVTPNVPNVPSVLHGEQAVKTVESREGRQLSPIERRIVLEEGFVPTIYKDSKGIPTYGVGQTGKWITKGFTATVRHHIERVRQRLPMYDQFPEFLKEELVQSEYRGDLGLSPKAMDLMTQGRYEQASKEFLDNAEYKNPKTSQGIKRRMKSTADAIEQYGKSLRQNSGP